MSKNNNIEFAELRKTFIYTVDKTFEELKEDQAIKTKVNGLLEDLLFLR